MKKQKLLNFFVLLLFSFALTACASKSQKQTFQTEQDTLAHDSFSARLIAAKELVAAENFKTKLLNGETFELLDQRGKVVILNIWATWCPPCVEEMPDLVDIHEKYQEEGLVILGVSIDKQGKSVVVPFVKKYNVTYPVTIDDGTIMSKYGPIIGIPTTYIIDKEGNLRYFATGAITKKELAPRVEKLLRE